MWLRRLIKGGYPMKGNDLPLLIWEDLALVNELIDIRTRIF